jgi:hypothetical protein
MQDLLSISVIVPLVQVMEGFMLPSRVVLAAGGLCYRDEGRAGLRPPLVVLGETAVAA